MLSSQAADGRDSRNDLFVTNTVSVRTVLYLTMGDNDYSKQLTSSQRERGEE